MYWVEFYLGVLVGLETLFIFLLYERIIRLTKKVWELEGIRKGEYFSSKRREDVINSALKDLNRK